MRDFTFGTIDERTFDEFSARHPQGNFQQTSRMAAVHRADGAHVSLLGVREAGTLVAATTLDVHKGRLSTFAEIHDGPLCDLHDRELTTFLFDNLRTFARKEGAAQLSITPEVVWQVRDSLGCALPTSEDAPWPAFVPEGVPTGCDQASFDTLTSCGFLHEGFDQEYNAIPRWRYVKDLTGITSEKDLLATYAKNTKRNVRIAETSAVEVTRATREELSIFHDICELSCEKQGFDNRPLPYFELLYDKLGDDAVFHIAYIDAAAYLKSWEDKRDGFLADVHRLERLIEAAKDTGKTDKNEKKLADVQSKYEASLNRVETARSYLEEDGARIPAAAALFVYHPHECVYLFSGSNPKYAKFYAATAIQHHVMCTCLERGITRYNFYGINGVFDDPDDPGRGLLEFKQGFSGYVEEMMGSFTLPVKPATYALKQLAHKVLKR